MIPLVILAGGVSRRMGGGDKPLRLVDGRPILTHIILRLVPAHSVLAISANGELGRFASFGLPVLPDATPGQGPLGGILAGLDWAASIGAAELLSVPGDCPFLPPDLASRLGAAPAMALSAGRRHPTASIWQIDCRARLRAHLQSRATIDRRQLGVAAFADTIGMRTVTMEAVDGTDPFLNVNTPADLEAAERRARAMPAPVRDAC